MGEVLPETHSLFSYLCIYSQQYIATLYLTYLPNEFFAKYKFLKLNFMKSSYRHFEMDFE